MCNLSLGIRENGALDALSKSVEALMETTKCSFSDAIKLLKISSSDEKKIVELIKERDSKD